MRQIPIITSLIVALFVFTACASDTSLPTLQATVASGPTQDAGSGFDPNLGGDSGSNESEPTPTRESDASIGGDTESGARGTGFNAQITGGSIDAVNDGGQYDCSVAGHRIASGRDAAPNITFTVPVENPFRTHSFMGVADDGTASAVVTLDSLDETYNTITGGTFTLDEVPEDAGDFVSGSFDFTVLDASGNEIGIRGDFAFETTSTSYCTF